MRTLVCWLSVRVSCCSAGGRLAREPTLPSWGGCALLSTRCVRGEQAQSAVKTVNGMLQPEGMNDCKLWKEGACCCSNSGQSSHLLLSLMQVTCRNRGGWGTKAAAPMFMI